MTGIEVNTTEKSYEVTFDKSIYDESTVANWLKLIEVENLSKRIDFDDSIMEIADEIKANIWQKEKKRLGLV